MKKWFDPLTPHEAGDRPELQWLHSKDWMSKDAVVIVSENGIVEKDLIRLVVQHIAQYVRIFIPSSKRFVLTLDGHSSRKGVE